MKKNIQIFFVMILSGAFLLTNIYAADDAPKAQYPILTTSAGQSGDITTLNIIIEEAGLKYDYCDVPTVDLLKAGVGLAGKKSEETGFHAEVYTDLEKYPKGTPYKTIIFAIGASLKGMGASGLTVDDEENRLKSLIDYCKENNIFIVAVHTGGMSKRGAPGGDNERMIDAIAPYADYIIVTADGNKDGRFSKISEENNIPLTEVEFALKLVDVFKHMFED